MVLTLIAPGVQLPYSLASLAHVPAPAPDVSSFNHGLYRREQALRTKSAADADNQALLHLYDEVYSEPDAIRNRTGGLLSRSEQRRLALEPFYLRDTRADYRLRLVE